MLSVSYISSCFVRIINGFLLTFQESFILCKLLSIAQFLKILRFLSKVLSLNESITLIRNDLRGS